MSGRKTKVEELGAQALVHELHAKGWDLKSIADEITSKYHRPISHMAIKRFLDGNPPPVASPAENMARAQDAIARVGATEANADVEYWNGILRLAATGLLKLLNDQSANARARAVAGQTLVDAAITGTKQAEVRGLIEARTKNGQSKATT